jgi:hypothetical protein
MQKFIKRLVVDPLVLQEFLENQGVNVQVIVVVVQKMQTRPQKTKRRKRTRLSLFFINLWKRNERKI